MFRAKTPELSIAKFQASQRRAAERDRVLTERELGQFTQPGSGLGMKELEKIVLDMKKDIRKIAKTQSLQGAQEYALARGYQRPEYTDQNEDGIPEIIIRNQEGDPMVINGYALAQSDWAFRNKYYTEHPTAAERKAKSSSAWLAEKTGVTYNREDPRKIEEMNDIRWLKRFGKAGYKSHVPKNRSSYNVFVTSVIKRLIAEDRDGETYKRHILSIAAYVWNNYVVKHSISNTYGDNGIQLWTKVADEEASPAEVDALAKLKTRKEYKDTVWVMVKQAVDDPGVVNVEYAEAKEMIDEKLGGTV